MTDKSVRNNVVPMPVHNKHWELAQVKLARKDREIGRLKAKLAAKEQKISAIMHCLTQVLDLFVEKQNSANRRLSRAIWNHVNQYNEEKMI